VRELEYLSQTTVNSVKVLQGNETIDSIVKNHHRSHHFLILQLKVKSCLYKGQIPLRYPARELVRELVCDLLASWMA